jgi:hypothetical protein
MRPVVAALIAVVAGLSAPAAGAAVLPKADRAAIDSTLDVFVPAAVGRRHSERAWKLTTAAMHVGGTRAGWARGELPVVPYPVAGVTFHGWSVDSVAAGRADIVLLLHPRRGAHVGPISCDVQMRKVKGRWLVASFVIAASFAPAGSVSSITAAADFAPGPAAPPFAKSGRVGEVWVLVIPGVLLGLVVLVPILVVLVHRRRDRRAARRYTSATRGV